MLDYVTENNILGLSLYFISVLGMFRDSKRELLELIIGTRLFENGYESCDWSTPAEDQSVCIKSGLTNDFQFWREAALLITENLQPLVLPLLSFGNEFFLA